MNRPAKLMRASLCAAALFATSPAWSQESTTKPAAPDAMSPEGADAPRREAAPQRPNRPNAGGARAGNVQVPDDIQLVRDVVYATAPGKDDKTIDLKMDCAFLKQSDGKPMPVVIYIHGGGWSGGDRAMGLPFSFVFAKGGYFACTVQYRLSGEATFPAQLHDVKSAVRFIRANAEKLGIDPERIGVWGHSAGGHLSALLGVTGDVAELEGAVGEKNGGSAVQAVVDVSGPTDLLLIAPGGDGGPMIAALLGGTVRDKQELAKQASPVNHVDAKDAPFLIIQGGNDQLVPDNQAEVMRDALKKSGVEVEYLFIEEAGHGVQDRRAFRATAEFFDKHLGGNVTEAMAEVGRRLPGAGQRPRAGDEPSPKPEGAATQPAASPQR